MADANYAKFSKRMRDIETRHRKMSRGYVQLVERDGLLVPASRSGGLRRGFPLRGLAVALALFLVFKAFLMVQLGATTYETRVAKLAAGTGVEQAGAWVMATDPISQWIAGRMRTLF